MGLVIAMMDTAVHHAKKLSSAKMIVQTMVFAIGELANASIATSEISVKV